MGITHNCWELFYSDFKYWFLERYPIKLFKDSKMGLSAGDIEKAFSRQRLLPSPWLLPEQRTVRVGGDGAWDGAGDSEGMQGRSALQVIREAPPRVWSEGSWSSFHHLSTLSTSSHSPLALSAPRQALTLAPSAQNSLPLPLPVAGASSSDHRVITSSQRPSQGPCPLSWVCCQTDHLSRERAGV